MKVRLTESQVRKAKLITEGQESINTFMTKADDIKELCNRLYSKLTFTTLAELLEGEADISIYQTKIQQWRTVLYTHNKKVRDFFDNMSEEQYEAEYYSKWQDIDINVEDKNNSVDKKLDLLEEMLDALKGLADSDIENHFKDIKKFDI
jgi:hypothetical protein